MIRSVTRAQAVVLACVGFLAASAAPAADLPTKKPPPEAQIVPSGSALEIITQNFPGCVDTTCSTLTTFNSTSSIANGSVTLVTTQQPTGGGEWDIFKLTTNSGGSIAGDINGDWSIDMQLQLSKNAVFDGLVSQWTTNGTPMSPINNFGGIRGANNPIPPRLSGISGPAFVVIGFKADYLAGPFDPNGPEFVDPFSFLSAGGMNPDLANGFTFALHFDPERSGVPEPSTWAMMLAGFAGLGLFGARRLAAAAAA